MVEEPNLGEGHGHTILIGGCDDLFVPVASPWLYHILHTMPRGLIQVVSEREESIRSESHPLELSEPFLFLLRIQQEGRLVEELEPCLFFWWRHFPFNVGYSRICTVHGFHSIRKG